MPQHRSRVGRPGEAPGKRVTWNLWHGNVLHALQRIDDLDDNLELLEENPTNKNKLKKAVQCRPAYRS